VRWARRDPSAAALVGVIVLAALSLLLGSWSYSLKLRAAMKDADNRRREAEAQKKEADEQKALVAANLQRRLDVVDDMLANSDGRLAKKPGMDSVRLEFLNEFLKISKQLLAEQGNDPAIRRQAARVYRSIGDLWADGVNARDAAANYAEAARLQKGLAEQFPDNADYQTDYAATRIRRAGVLAASGQHPEARESALEAVGVMDRLAEKFPENVDYRQKAARYRFHLASDRETAGDVAEARTGYGEAL